MSDPWRSSHALKRATIVLRVTQIWIAILIVGSLQPSRPERVAGLHREIHWVAFAGAAWLALLFSRTRRDEVRNMIAVCCLGVLLEWLQNLLYRKGMEWLDVGDDILATIVTFAVYRSARAWSAASSAPPPSTKL